MSRNKLLRPFHIMAKPAGPLCNIDCSYCFYVGKTQDYEKGHTFRMSDEVLETYIRDYIEANTDPEVTFAWQGGEPTLLGIPFFEKVLKLQAHYAPAGTTCHNALQTNGTRLNKDWGRLLADPRFLVGLSIDGPAELHDFYRKDLGGKGTHGQVMRGIETLHAHGVEFNTLTVVNRRNSNEPLEVYRFLRRIGSGFIQFIPLVERATDGKGKNHQLCGPPTLGSDSNTDPVTRWSVRPKTFGKFLTTIFDEWVRRDVGKVFVQTFDVMLGAWAQGHAGLCAFSKECGNALALEHDGSLYACDHYVYPEYRLGHITETNMRALAESPQQQQFGRDKFTTLPDKCQACSYQFACYGECPKHRFLNTDSGQPGLNYLCEGYEHFFEHIDPAMQRMTQLWRMGQAPAAIMQDVKACGSYGGFQTAWRQRSMKQLG